MKMQGWQHHFQNIMTDGNIRFDDRDYEGARLLFQEAFKLIPEPKQKLDESTQAIGALADCYYHLKEFGKAKAALDDALICPGGAANPFIRLRRGQVFAQTGDLPAARTELTTAFLNGSVEIFEGEEDSLALISDVIKSLAEGR